MTEATRLHPETVHLNPVNSPEYWRGAVAWQPTGDDQHPARPWRLLPERARRAHAPDLIEKAQMAAGVRVEVTTDAAAVRLPLHVNYETPVTVDLTIDGELAERRQLDTGAHTITQPLPEGTHDLRIWLPQVGRTAVGAVELSGVNLVAPIAGRPRWITYGSSITQCSAAAGPSETWPAVAATSLGWDLTCLGFGAQCHLDPIVERTIETLPADVISLCLGINIHGGGTFNERSFGAQAAGFIERIRDAHPGIPIAVITPIVAPPREHGTGGGGLSLVQMRAILAEVVAELAEDDSDLRLIDGLSVLGSDDAHLLPDDLHPDGQGYQLMGTRLAKQLSTLV